MQELPAQTRADIAQAVRAALARYATADELYQIACAVLYHHVPGGRMSLYVLDGDRLWLRGARGYPTTIQAVPLGRGYSSQALLESRTVHVPHGLDRHPLHIPAMSGLESAIAVPFGAAETRGVLIMESTERTGADVVEVVEDAANALSEALARLPDAERTRAPLTARLARMFVLIGAMREAPALLELTARCIGEALDLDCVQVLERDGAELAPVSAWTLDGDMSLQLGDVLLRDVVAAGAGSPWLAHAGREVRGLPADVARARGIGAMVCLPLRAGGDELAVLVGYARAGREHDASRFDEAALLASHAATALANLRAFESKELEASTDALTGLLNFRRFSELGEDMMTAARADGFALVLADLDDFKLLNDLRGHGVGDDALRQVGATLARSLRVGDSAFRIGGEEFVLLLPGTTYANARTVCRRIQRWLEGIELGDWRLTLSFGVARYPDDGASLRAVLDSADAALYEAKRRGKDRITRADEKLLGGRAAARARRSRDHQARLAAAVSALAGAAGAESIATALLEALADTLPHDSSCLIVQQGDYTTVAGDEALAAAPALARILAEPGTHGRSRILDDVAVEGFGEASLLVAPLIARSATRGALVALAHAPVRFYRDDQHVIDVLAATAALALDAAGHTGSAVAQPEIGGGVAAEEPAGDPHPDADALVGAAIERVSANLFVDLHAAYADARDAHGWAARVAEPGARRRRRLTTLVWLARTEYATGRPDDAFRHALAALPGLEQEPAGAELFSTLNLLGLVATDAGDLEQGVSWLERAQVVAQQIGDTHSHAVSLVNLTRAYHALGRREQATTLVRRAIEVARRGDGRGGLVASAHVLAVSLLLDAGEIAAARVELDAAFGALGDDGDPVPVAEALIARADLECASGDGEAALVTLSGAAELARETGYGDVELRVQESRGRALLSLGRAADAVEVLTRVVEGREITPTWQRSALRRLADAAEASGDLPCALAAMRRGEQLEERLRSDRLEQQVALLEVRHRIELARRDTALARRDAEISQLRTATLEVLVERRTRELEVAQLEVLDRLALVSESHDRGTGSHTERVGRRAAGVARELGMPDRDIDLIRAAARLHDIGKVAVPTNVLLKPGRLTESEFELVKAHAAVGASILGRGNSVLLRMAEQIAHAHHERWDGAGYPRRLAGDHIPLPARIVAVIDVYDALISERPYKPAWEAEAALAEIVRCSGTQFDPEVVAAFLRVMAHEGVAVSAVTPAAS